MGSMVVDVVKAANKPMKRIVGADLGAFVNQLLTSRPRGRRGDDQRGRCRQRRDARVPAGDERGAVHTAFFFSAPRSVHRATQSGTWGDARDASAEYGERYPGLVTEATARMLDDIERMFEAIPARR